MGRGTRGRRRVKRSKVGREASTGESPGRDTWICDDQVSDRVSVRGCPGFVGVLGKGGVWKLILCTRKKPDGAWQRADKATALQREGVLEKKWV
jgi:hypothetical protein